MRILLDEDLPRRLGRLLTGHEPETVHRCGWSGVKNGKLLALAATKFDVFLTMDQNMALNPAPFGRWTLRDAAAQRRLALRWAAKTTLLDCSYGFSYHFRLLKENHRGRTHRKRSQSQPVPPYRSSG